MSEIILPKFMNIGGGKIKSITDILKKIIVRIFNNNR